VSDCCLMPIQQIFSYILARTSYFSMRWWWGPLCTRSTRWVLVWTDIYIFHNNLLTVY